jgi:NAD(P)-dependent dehydrogenase (short-subunit alcohol dehydrogenase family)
MDLQLNDRVVIVTAAAAGVGRATAGLLTAEGAVVVGVDRDEIETGPGQEGSAIRADLTDAASAPRIVETVMQRYGRIDGLVNNAGVVEPRHRCRMGRRRWGPAPDLKSDRPSSQAPELAVRRTLAGVT